MLKCTFKIAVLSLSAFAFVSCKKDDKPAATGDMMTFTGRIGGGAKTEINGFDMTWSKGDQVRINGKVFDSELTTDRKTATFTGAMTLADEYEAYYPASLYDETGNKYVLPATQTCYPDSVNTLSDINPMYAKSTTTDLTFHNICALIRLSVTGDGIVKEIVVSAKQNGQPALLSGAFVIKGDASDGYYAEVASTSDGGSESLTLDCGDGVPLDKDNATMFYVAVPQGEYTDLKFTLTGIGGITWSSSPVTRNLEAGKMQARELVGVSVAKPATLPGEFTINSGGTKVKFSKGNLWYDGANFHFETNQWETTPSAVGQTGSSGAYSSSHVSHFLWSPDKTVAVGTSTSVSGTVNDVFFTNAAETTASSSFQVDGEEAGTWRTLSKAEWAYLINTRSGDKYAKANVSGVRGLLIFPDGYSGTTSGTGIATVNTANAAFPDDNILSNTWASMESSGAVFLPASGRRYGTDVYNVGFYGYYWSSTPVGSYEDCAYYLDFNSGYVGAYDDYRFRGYAVRLVR